MGRRTRRALVALNLALPLTAHATNGYFAHGYSVAQQALGGAGTAYASDALSVSINPASVALLPERLDFGVGLFQPERWYTASDRGSTTTPGIFTLQPGRVDSHRPRFGIPAIAYTHPLGEDSAWGIAMYGNGGMNTDYRGTNAHFAQNIPGADVQCEGPFGGGAPVGGMSDTFNFCGNGIANQNIDLIQLFIVPSYAVRFGEASAFGVAPVLAGQRFFAKGLAAFRQFSNEPGKVSDAGYSYSYGAGARLGITYGEIPHLALAASWQSRVRMTDFKEYAGLFANHGGFDIPSTWNLGAAVGIGDRHRVLLDYQRVNFSEVLAVGNRFDPNDFVNHCALPRLRGDTSPSRACLGSATGPGFGWRDVSTWKLGYELALGTLKLRAGYSRNQQPIPEDQVLFNILAPAVPQEHFTAGLSWPLTKTWGLDFAATYAKNHPVTGKNPLSSSTATPLDLAQALAGTGTADTSNAFGPDPNDQDVTLEMKQFIFTVGLSYSFEALK